MDVVKLPKKVRMVCYPNDYFESLHYDFISRCDGDEWPE